MSRDAILDAAAQIFRQKGYHATSMQDIASAVNLQKASLYHHVASKQEILLELLERALRVISSQVVAVAEQDLPSDEKLRQMMRCYLRLLAEQNDLAAVLLFEHRSLDGRSHARHVPSRDRFEALWRDVIIAGVRAGKFVCPDPALTVRGMMGVMNWTLTWYRPGGALTTDQIADSFAGLFLDGLRSGRAG